MLYKDLVSREVVKEKMIKYGFHAPDMTVTEFVEDELPPGVVHLTSYPYVADNINDLPVISKRELEKCRKVKEKYTPKHKVIVRHCWECAGQQTYKCSICKDKSQFVLKCDVCIHNRTSICGNCKDFDEFERIEKKCDTCDRNVCATRTALKRIDKCVNYEPKKDLSKELELAPMRNRVMSCDDCCYEPNSPFCEMYRKDICGWLMPSEQKIVTANESVLQYQRGYIDGVNHIIKELRNEHQQLQKPLKCRNANCGAMCSPAYAEIWSNNPEKCPNYKRLDRLRGEWEDCSNGWMCSVCKSDNSKDTNFCPNCGADMRGNSK